MEISLYSTSLNPAKLSTTNETGLMSEYPDTISCQDFLLKQHLQTVQNDTESVKQLVSHRDY